VRAALPFLPVFAGLGLSVWRFRADDPLLGLVFALGGVLLMIAIATALPAERT
jgi:hypothetical protein